MLSSYLDDPDNDHDQKSKDIWSEDFEGTWLLLSIPGIMIAGTIVVALIVSLVKHLRK